MNIDSRKGQRDRYARHRADLLFWKQPAGGQGKTPSMGVLHEGTESDLVARERVRAGIIGFVSATPEKQLRP